jgi:hypothetical protein
MELKPPIQLEHASSNIDQPQATQFSYLLTGATNAIIGPESETRPSARVSRTSTFFASEFLAALPSTA